MAERGSLVADGAVPSEPSVREEIARIIAEVLRLDDIANDDDFFALGGHSLTASQVSSRIYRSLGVEVPLSVFFERPTVLGLAEYVTAGGAAPGSAA
ncbi:phosphopantetheine-binding protein [Streptomyces sp. NPDC007205]|uniref:phosphopantetheine-binding protein n=1 Tax=Streptomyces sp. NPDC007205 TaxID=3154316 RepID=UPI0034058B0B